MSNISRHKEDTARTAMHARSNLIKVFKPVIHRQIHLHSIGVVMLPINATHDVYRVVDDSDASFTDVDERITRSPRRHRRRVQHLDSGYRHWKSIRIFNVAANDIEAVTDSRHAVIAAWVYERWLISPCVANWVIRDHTSTVSIKLLSTRHVDSLATHGCLHTEQPLHVVCMTKVSMGDLEAGTV